MSYLLLPIKFFVQFYCLYRLILGLCDRQFTSSTFLLYRVLKRCKVPISGLFFCFKKYVHVIDYLLREVINRVVRLYCVYSTHRRYIKWSHNSKLFSVQRHDTFNSFIVIMLICCCFAVQRLHGVKHFALQL